MGALYYVMYKRSAKISLSISRPHRIANILEITTVKKSLLSLLALTLLLGATRPVVAQETKPLVVVTFSGYDELIKDLNYVGQLSGKPQLGQTLEGLLGFFTGGQGLQGLDKSKPWGAILATDGAAFPKAVYLPVTDVQKLMASLVTFIGMPQDAGDGIWQVEVQANQTTLFIKAEDGWARIAQQAEDIKLLPKDPTGLMGGLEKQYDIGVRALVSNIPEELKQTGIALLTQSVNNSLQQNEGEDDEAFAQRKKLALRQVDNMVTSINELEHFTIGLSIDQKQKKTYLDFATSAVPGTKSAETLAALKDAKSNFGGFIQPGLLSLGTVSKFGAEDIAPARQQMDDVRAKLMQELEKSTEFPTPEAKAAITSLIGDLFDLFNVVLDSGKFDMAASVIGQGPFTLIAGLHTGEGANLPQLVDKIVEALKIEGTLAGFEKDVAKQDEVGFHKIAIKAPTGPEAEKIGKAVGPGDIQLIVGTGKDRLYLGAGADPLKALQAAIAQSKASVDAPAMPMQMTLSLAQILKAAAFIDESAAPLAAMAGMLEQTGNDKVRLSYQANGNAVTMRLEAEEGVIQVLGTISAAKQGAAGF